MRLHAKSTDRITASIIALALLAGMMSIVVLPARALAQATDGFERPLVTVTFDDGYQSVYDNALPVLQSLGIKSTQFIITGNTDTDPFFMTSAELLAMYNLGHELGSHSVSHPDLTTLTPAELDYQLSASKAFLETLTGGTVEDFAYPFGIYNDTVVAAVRQHYLAARCSVAGINSRTGFNEYLVKAQAVVDTTTPDEVQGWIDDAIANNYWLVIMYHQIDDAAGEYHTTPANLALEMQYLSGTGVTVETMKDAMQEIRPWFRQYTVGASVAGGMGEASPASQNMGYLEPASISIAPANGFSTGSIVDNGIAQLVADPYVIPQVRADHTVQVTFQPLQPVITGFQPARASPGSQVTLSGANFQDSQGTSTVSFDGIPVTEYSSWSNDSIVVVMPPGARSGRISVTTDGGTGTSVADFHVVLPTWYLAEGTTAWGFQTYISIANPNREALDARVTYVLGGGRQVVEKVRLSVLSQTTLTNDHLVSMFGEADFSTSVTCVQGQTIAVDRTMTWTGSGARSPEGHSSIGATSPATTWYLPEGSSRWGFETWLLVQNPNASRARVRMTYMTETDGPIAIDKVVPAHTRTSYSMSQAIGAEDASIQVTSDVPVVAERSLYRNNRREGQCSIGTTTPSGSCYLAEGSSAWGFTTFVLVQNPDSKPTTVHVTYMTPTGAVSRPSFVMAPSSRKTIRVNDELPGTDFSTLVVGSRPLVAERSMYWDNGTGEACHDSIGIEAPQRRFALPDGQTSGGRQTWTLVQNPNAAPVDVIVSYLLAGGGGEVHFRERVAANSRKTFSMADSVRAGRYATTVESVTPGKFIVVERSMYWNNRGAGTDTIAAPADI
jgi:peptidoglycan/xylan/chitin deacetylase (PgdA/CDA1 family)